MSLTKVDWFTFRTAGAVGPTCEALRGVFGPLGSCLTVRDRDRGLAGFDRSADLSIADMRVGVLAYGGESQRGWVMVSLTGAGCGWVPDWQEAQEAVAPLPGYELRRVDVALDTVDRSVSHDSVVEAYRAGQFTTRGRPPNMERIEPEDPCGGRTVYVGSRQQGKFFRGYEKGYELAKHFPKHVQPTHIDGVPIGDIYRCEMEFKAKVCSLPVDLIDRRDQYFAGSYPFLEHLLNVEPEIFVQRREQGPQLELKAALAQVRHQYGNALFTALAAYHGDMTAVWDQIVGTRHNNALLEAGVLMVDHD